MMTIHVPQGSAVVPLDAVSAHGNREREVFLPLVCALDVTSIELGHRENVHVHVTCVLREPIY